MTSKIYGLLIALLFIFSIPAFAQTPPPPNGSNNPTGGGNTPVGGGAPIGSGLIVLLLLGAAYGSKKVFQLKSKENKKQEN